jgi:tetratricopeptide (TPR) repeat protein
LVHANDQLEDYPEAIKWYERAVGEYPSSEHTWQAPYRLGLLYREYLHQYEQAICWFEQQRRLYSIESTSQQALFSEGIVYLFNLSDCQKATGVFQEYVELYPESENAPLAFYNLALCYEKTGDRKQAIELLRIATDLYPNTIFTEDIEKKIAELQEEK